MDPRSLHLVSQIMEGYCEGLFLMADERDGSLAWYNSPMRTLIPLDERFHCPRSLKPVLNRGQFTPRINQAFEEVVQGCANRDETWISPELQKIYTLLHQAGWAYSFETWQGEELAGGILGIVIGGVFIGESMFFRIPNGSKAALVYLVRHLQRQRFLLFDAQLMNPHLARFGAYEIDQTAYRKLLAEGIRLPSSL